MLHCFQKKAQEEYTFTVVGGSQAHGTKWLRAVGAVMVDRFGFVVELSVNQHSTSKAWAIDLRQSIGGIIDSDQLYQLCVSIISKNSSP